MRQRVKEHFRGNARGWQLVQSRLFSVLLEKLRSFSYPFVHTYTRHHTQTRSFELNLITGNKCGQRSLFFAINALFSLPKAIVE